MGGVCHCSSLGAVPESPNPFGDSRHFPRSVGCGLFRWRAVGFPVEAFALRFGTRSRGRRQVGCGRPVGQAAHLPVAGRFPVLDGDAPIHRALCGSAPMGVGGIRCCVGRSFLVLSLVSCAVICCGGPSRSRSAAGGCFRLTRWTAGRFPIRGDAFSSAAGGLGGFPGVRLVAADRSDGGFAFRSRRSRGAHSLRVRWAGRLPCSRGSFLRLGR